MLERVRNEGAQNEHVGHLGQALRTHAKVGLDRRRQRAAVLIEEFAHAQQAFTAHQQGTFTWARLAWYWASKRA